VLGIDNATSPQPCSAANLHAVDFQMSSSSSDSIGTIYAANGSIDLSGFGSIAGVVDAGSDILIEGSNTKQGLQYSIAQSKTALNTGTLAFQSYIEY